MVRNLLSPQVTRRGYTKSRKKKRLGFDLHGVIEARSDFFRSILRDLIKQGWEIHIITGGQWAREKNTLERLRIPFTHFFSIVDYHVALGTKIRWDKKGNAHINTYLWDRTKGQYCLSQKISLHMDDSDIYGYFFKTPYLRYYSKDSRRTRKTHV